MSIAAHLIDLVLVRHRIRAARPFILDLLGAAALFLGLTIFAMTALAILLFIGLWVCFNLMVMAGLGNLSAGLFIGAGLVVIALGLAWGINRALKTLARTFEALIGEGVSVPGQKVLGGAVSGTIRIANAFRRGLKGAAKARTASF